MICEIPAMVFYGSDFARPNGKAGRTPQSLYLLVTMASTVSAAGMQINNNHCPI
jgi:hypothetical protein